jgi:hypothetical protein
MIFSHAFGHLHNSASAYVAAERRASVLGTRAAIV